MLTTVEHVVARMNGLMLQLRAGANPVEKPHLLDLGALVRRVCTSKSGSRAAIDVECAGPIACMGHEDRLEHVFGHLLQNALDATQTGGNVSVQLENDAQFASIVLADTGVGKSEAFVRERLFKPFQTTKASGMGIGVYESVQYVSSIGGDILVESHPGSGTVVRVRLPVTAASEAQAPAMKEETA
jgi:signal transduction histidine kinase